MVEDLRDISRRDELVAKTLTFPTWAGFRYNLQRKEAIPLHHSVNEVLVELWQNCIAAASGLFGACDPSAQQATEVDSGLNVVVNNFKHLHCYQHWQ